MVTARLLHTWKHSTCNYLHKIWARLELLNLTDIEQFLVFHTSMEIYGKIMIDRGSRDIFLSGVAIGKMTM